jgi:membrane-associated protease RseP (regulator of RpoE activity)
MKRASRVNAGLASSLLALVAFVSALLLVYSRASGNLVVQAVTMLVSMGLVFYAGHPLGHFFAAKAYGVSTEYFFVGRSDFRKLKLKPMSVMGGLMPTIGTKLRKDEFASLSPRKRGYVFGAGVIVSNALVGIQLLYVLFAGFSLPAALLGALFFAATLATELVFSTKVGDLGKMRREFEKQLPGNVVAGHPP